MWSWWKRLKARLMATSTPDALDAAQGMLVGFVLAGLFWLLVFAALYVYEMGQIP